MSSRSAIVRVLPLLASLIAIKGMSGCKQSTDHTDTSAQQGDTLAKPGAEPKVPEAVAGDVEETQAMPTQNPAANSPETAAAGVHEDPSAQDKARAEQEKLITAAIQRIPQIQRDVAELRQLRFDQPIPAQWQDQGDFRSFVKDELLRELPREKNKALSAALHHIGLLPTKIDLRQTLEDAMVSQAGAYYDPEQKKYFLVMAPPAQLMLDTLSAHELTHALQDQHFDLNKYYYGSATDRSKSPFSEDELNARRFVVEGEATLIMMGYVPYSTLKMNLLAPDKLEALAPQIQQMAALNAPALAQQTKAQAGQQAALWGDELTKSIEALDTIPNYILAPLLESYSKGVLPVFQTLRLKGMKGVNELYRNPPSSTEQVLHPVEKLIRKRDEPIKVGLPDVEGWTVTHSDVMGELLWRVYLEQWKVTDADRAAAGWGGDRYAVYERDGVLVGILGTTWDTQRDASDFHKAYLESLNVRFPTSLPRPAADGRGTVVPRTGKGDVYVRLRGKDVFIVDGSPDDSWPQLASSKIMKTRTRTK